ncbi:MAG TPA: hypothetical protein VFW68_05830 [Rhodocyclaceae bacterium]|nr:hypothetical protein [Rhodocyclaceae bacterium]
MKRTIYTQGDLDGACFLYCLANSYVALTGKGMTSAQWRKSLKSVPFRLDDFLSGDLGTGYLNDDFNYLEGLCHNFLQGAGNAERFEVTSKKQNLTLRSLKASISDEQVAIIAIEKGNHWVSVVDADKDRFYIACSAEALNAKHKYAESVSPNHHRHFNRTASFAEFEIYKDSGLLVRCVGD